MKKFMNNKLMLIVGLLLTMLLVSGGTFAYFQWQSSLEDKSNVIVSVTDDIRMTINPAAVTKTGMRPTNNCGGSFGMQGTSLVTIDNNTGILARPRFKLKLKITDKDGNNITNETSPMGNPYRQYIKYAVAETDGSCTSPLSSGRFNLNTETSVGSGWYESTTLTLNDADGFPAISDGTNTGVSFDAYADNVTTHTYKVWIWIDETYTAVSTGNTVTVDKLQDATITVSWSDNSSVEQVHGDGVAPSVTIVRPEGVAYAVYSEDDTSLRFYRSETPIEEGSTYNNLTATAVYTDFEDVNYDDYETIPWMDYEASISKIVFEDEIVPISTAFWFNFWSEIELIDIQKLNTSYVTNMAGMFGMICYDGLLDLRNMVTSKVTDMSEMFWGAGQSCPNFLVNVSGWDTSKVLDMSYMFASDSYEEVREKYEIIGLNTWNVSKVTDMEHMFESAGFNATNFSLDLSNWNLSSITNINDMFSTAGYNTTGSWTLNVSGWNTSKITDMSSMFSNIGTEAEEFSIIGLDDWNTSNVTNMSEMFVAAGRSATTWSIGDLSGWDTGKVKDMSNMFGTSWTLSAGFYASTFNIGNIGNWDVSNVEDMSAMFWSAGDRATTWYIGDLSEWDVSSVKKMNDMFRAVGGRATNLNIGNISGWDTSNVIDMAGMFMGFGSDSLNYTLNLSGWDVSNVHAWVSFGENFGGTITEPSWNKGELYYAVYSVTDKSLRFYNKNNTITEGGTFNGLKVTKLYTLHNNEWFFSGDYIYWSSYRDTITNVVVENTIQPTNTAWWFYYFKNCGNYNLTKLTTSNVISMRGMFYYAGESASSFVVNGLNSWNTSKVTDMAAMFHYSGKNVTDYVLTGLNNWDVSNVTDMGEMFYGAGYNSTTRSYGDLSGWDTGNVTDMNHMFWVPNYTANSSLNLSGWNVCKVSNYKSFVNGNNDKITVPNWGMQCPTT